jgi:RNA polymerase sigma-B factor
MATNRSAVYAQPRAPEPASDDSARDTLESFREYRRSRNAQQYQELVCRFLPLVQRIARRYVRPGVAAEDLEQIGTIGLMNAVTTFDPERGVRFETYAFHHIAGEIRHHLRDGAQSLRVPRWVQSLHASIMKTVGELQQRLGRTPTLQEIAQQMNMTEAGVLDVLRAREQSRVNSMTDLVDERELSRELGPQRFVSFQLPIEDRIVLTQAIGRLADVQRKVLFYLFYRDMTQSETAKRLGVSQRHVSRLLASALRALAVRLRSSEHEPSHVSNAGGGQ